ETTARPRDRETSVRRFAAGEPLRAFDADLAEFLLVELDVVRQSLDKLLCVQRRHDGPAVNLHVGTARHDSAEVDDEFAGRVDDVREVDVFALRDVVIESDADRLLLLLLFYKRSVGCFGRAGGI